jgi:hypothetical protein
MAQPEPQGCCKAALDTGADQSDSPDQQRCCAGYLNQELYRMWVVHRPRFLSEGWVRTEMGRDQHLARSEWFETRRPKYATGTRPR